MTIEEIKALLVAKLPGADIEVQSDGYHVDVVVVSAAFEGLMPVKKQQMVYAALNDKITDGSIHAVNMKLYTPAQWQAQAAKA